MKIISTAQMRKIDRIAVKQFGISSLILMENAGRGIAEVARSMIKKQKPNILVVCGKGNNGGDGFVAARHLLNYGFSVRILMIGTVNDLKQDAAVNFNILRKMKSQIVQIENDRNLRASRRAMRDPDLIIDALFGIGIDRPVDGLFYKIISMINQSRRPVLSVDIPSGLNSDTGEVMGIAVKASRTGTLAAIKKGLVVRPGPNYAGKINILDISIPKFLIDRIR